MSIAMGSVLKETQGSTNHYQPESTSDNRIQMNPNTESFLVYNDKTTGYPEISEVDLSLMKVFLLV